MNPFIPALTALLLFSTPAPQPTTTAGTIILVRHAERTTPDGDTPLSAKGKERAQALERLLGDVDLEAIFVSQMIRTQETAAPIAQRRGLTPHAIPTTELDALVEKLRGTRAGRTALVVHHGGTIPQIVEKLGGGKMAPIPEDEFDRVVVLTGGATPSVMILRYGPR